MALGSIPAYLETSRSITAGVSATAHRASSRRQPWAAIPTAQETGGLRNDHPVHRRDHARLDRAGNPGLPARVAAMTAPTRVKKYEPAELLQLISERYRAGKSPAAIARDLDLSYRGVRRLIERAQSDGLLPEPAPAEPERTADWVAVPMGSYRAPADQLATVAAGRDAGKTPQQIAKENGWRLARVLVLLSEIPERYVTTPIEPRPGVVYAPVVDVEPVALEPLGLEPRREPRRAEQPKHEPLGDDVLTTTACRRMPGGRWHHGKRRAKKRGGPKRAVVTAARPAKRSSEFDALADLLRDPRRRARQAFYRELRHAVRHGLA